MNNEQKNDLWKSMRYPNIMSWYRANVTISLNSLNLVVRTNFVSNFLGKSQVKHQLLFIMFTDRLSIIVLGKAQQLPCNLLFLPKSFAETKDSLVLIAEYTCYRKWARAKLCNHRSLNHTTPLWMLTLKLKTLVLTWAFLTIKDRQTQFFRFIVQINCHLALVCTSEVLIIAQASWVILWFIVLCLTHSQPPHWRKNKKTKQDNNNTSLLHLSSNTGCICYMNPPELSLSAIRNVFTTDIWV